MRKLNLLYLLLLLSPGAFAQITFTTNGTFTVPAGVTSVTVEVVGAGGNGGPNGGGGGGGGGYSKGTFTVVPNATHAVIVGTAGSTTATSIASLGIQATPGSNGAGGPNPAPAGGAGGVGTGGTTNRTGGTGGAGTWTYFGGGGGGAAGAVNNGGNGGSTPPWNNNCLQPGGSAGIGGGAPGGDGGKGAGFTDANCNVTNAAATGVNYGGGGGGGNGNGGPAMNGANGFVSISWCNTGAPTGTATQNFCAPATVAALTATGTDIKWYATATGGTSLTPTTVLQNNTIYYASQTVTGCESATRLAVTAMVTTVNINTTQVGTTLSAAATGATYQWYNCDSNKVITGATNQSYTATKNGNYAVIVTQNNCKDTSAGVPMSSVGLTPLSRSGEIRVYPNPARDIVVVSVQPTMIGTAYRITDAVGKTVLTGVLKMETTEIPVRHLPAGAYQLHAGNGSDLKFRVIKE